MPSNKLIHLSKEVNTQGQLYNIEEFITDKYVYAINNNGQATIFLKECNKRYTVVQESQVLKEIDSEKKVAMVSQLKKELKQFHITSEEKQDCEVFKLAGWAPSLVINGEFVKSAEDHLQGTAHSASYQHANRTSLVYLAIEEGELITKSDLKLNINGQQVTTTSVVTKVIELKDNIDRYDHVLNYRIAG